MIVNKCSTLNNNITVCKYLIFKQEFSFTFLLVCYVCRLTKHGDCHCSGGRRGGEREQCGARGGEKLRLILLYTL